MPPHVATEAHETLPPEHDDFQTLTELMTSLLPGSVTVAEVESNEVLDRFGENLDKKKDALRSLKTSKLWMQYLDMVDIVRNFIKGERTGNWSLHMQSLYDMLPYFAASGHNMYLKSVHLHIQKMSKLQEQHPEAFLRRTSCHSSHRQALGWFVYRPDN